MSAETVRALSASGFSLYGFMAVGGSDRAGLPLVWLQTSDYSLRTEVSWTERFEAYTSFGTVARGASIHAAASYAIAAGETLEVEDAKGTGTVVRGGVPGALSIENRTVTPLACGLAPAQGGVSSPSCVFPLHGNNLQILVPVQRVLLMFSVVQIPPGTAIGRASGPGILIDSEGARERAVAFDIDAGWSAGGSTWAQQVTASANIVPLLVIPVPIDL
ncbi:uncharacterized protein SOCE26_049510 [Sorangium cellulosum]|uniref:Uncharacterized protein n=1 Tax=Sorangium cellulosum TaxID=56 RepID=A0A2L0EW49_SORCE|nr:hypothetical protein [Sorangium cellulosum]AUX43502.1 uncharacterized protein SOCE26_049510 [Sorangium cellulosum]